MPELENLQSELQCYINDDELRKNKIAELKEELSAPGVDLNSEENRNKRRQSDDLIDLEGLKQMERSLDLHIQVFKSVLPPSSEETSEQQVEEATQEESGTEEPSVEGPLQEESVTEEPFVEEPLQEESPGQEPENAYEEAEQEFYEAPFFEDGV